MARRVVYLIGVAAAVTSVATMTMTSTGAAAQYSQPAQPAQPSASTPAPPQERRARRGRDAPAQPITATVSPAFSAAYSPVNAAIVAVDWPTAETGLAALKAAAVSPYELYLAAQTEFRIASATRDTTRQATVLDAMIASNGAPTADIARVLTASGQMAYNAGDYSKAAQRIEAAMAASSSNPGMEILRLDALMRSNQLDAGLSYGNQLIATARAAGQKPADDIYGIVGVALQGANRETELATLLVHRTTDYPTAGNLRSASVAILNSTVDDRGQTLDILRLMMAAEAINDRRFYLEYAANLAEDGLPNEALMVARMGRAAGLIPADDVSFREIETGQRDKLADDRASLPGTERRAALVAEARLAQVVGDAYYGYNNYAKAEEMYRLSLGKTGANVDLLHTRIGIARFGAGNFAGAMEEFALVQSGTRGAIVRLWEAVTRTRLSALVAVPATEQAAATPPPAS